MFGQRLRLARKRAGLSMRSLAERMTPKVTAQAISKYEAGQMLPSSAVLVALGRALDVSLDFLMSGQVEALHGLEFRKHSNAPLRDRARAEAILIDNLERHLAIEQILDMPGTVDWIEQHRCDRVASEAQIDAKADELRNSWNLGMDPIPSLCELLEERGIKVVEADLPGSINGLACRALKGSTQVAEAVVVSTRINVERKRFTLAHELAHRIIRSTGNPAIDAEKAMNRFAGAFLVPGQRLREAVGTGRHRVTYYEIVRLKHAFGVSAAAMLHRLGDVGVLPPARVKSAFATFARSWRKTEPEPLLPHHGFANSERPRRLKLLVSRAVGEGLISPVRAALLLNESLDSIEQQIGGPTIQ